MKMGAGAGGALRDPGPADISVLRSGFALGNITPPRRGPGRRRLYSAAGRQQVAFKALRCGFVTSTGRTTFHRHGFRENTGITGKHSYPASWRVALMTVTPDAVSTSRYP